MRNKKKAKQKENEAMNQGKKLLTFTAVIAVLLFTASTEAWAAKDRLRVKINQVSPGIVALTEAGSPLAQGAFSSSSSIKVQYELTAFNFQAGMTEFGTFDLGLEIEDRSAEGGADTSYSPAINVNIGQNGGDAGKLLVSALPNSYSGIAGSGSLGTSAITIKTNCTIANPCPTTDGSEIEANLQFSSSPPNALDTSVKVQVRIKLVHPTQCLQLYNFLTDQDLTTDVSSTEVVVVKSGRNAGKVNATTPFGQFSQNVMVVNTCSSTESFNLSIMLDSSFDTNPNDNPGNAVFTYVAGREIDPENFNINDFSGKTPQGQMLCLTNISLAGDKTFLATVHMGIQRGIYKDSLPEGDFEFSAGIQPAGPDCGGALVGYESATMSYTIK
jgi:hypothetical protein